jgi:hypothetical protein
LGDHRGHVVSAPLDNIVGVSSYVTSERLGSSISFHHQTPSL